MRRLILVAGLVGSFLLVAFTGWGFASVGGGAHQAQATIPMETYVRLMVLKSEGR